MRLKIVKESYQNNSTPEDKIQYPGENWCCHIERFMDMNQWFEKLNKSQRRINAGNEITVYLRGIEACSERIVVDMKTGESREQIVYYVNAAYKNLPIECNKKSNESL